jgi:hypothetical protein
MSKSAKAIKRVERMSDSASPIASPCGDAGAFSERGEAMEDCAGARISRLVFNPVGSWRRVG